MDKARSIAGLDHVVLYDGVCKFCNNSVNFILKHEKEGVLKFVSLQSDLGSEVLKHYNLPVDYVDSILFLRSNRLYDKSSAVLKISTYLKKPWPLASIFLLIPRGLKDLIYDFFAKNRYKWFGIQQTCMLPPPNYKLRFLS